MLMNTGAQAIRSTNNLLTTIAWQLDGKTEYALEALCLLAERLYNGYATN